MSEEMVRRILRDVASMPIPQDECGGYGCPFCNADSVVMFTEVDEVQHKPNCTILLARKELRERGMPMQVYSVIGEYLAYKDNRGDHWRRFQAYTLADCGHAFDEWLTNNRRNVQIGYVRELKPEEGGQA